MKKEKKVDLLTEIQQDYQEKKPNKEVIKKREADSLPFISTLILLAGLLIVTGVAIGMERYASWRAEHEWQRPVNWVGFVREKDKTKTEVLGEGTNRKLSEEQILEQYKLAPVLKSIYLLESTSGEKDGCRDTGEFNGFGFAQNNDSWMCYKSFEDVASRVNAWFEKRLGENGNNLIEAVCYYNTGIENQSTCGDYSENFWSVISRYF